MITLHPDLVYVGERICRQILETVSLLDDYAVSRLKKMAEERKA